MSHTNFFKKKHVQLKYPWKVYDKENNLRSKQDNPTKTNFNCNEAFQLSFNITIIFCLVQKISENCEKVTIIVFQGVGYRIKHCDSSGDHRSSAHRLGPCPHGRRILETKPFLWVWAGNTHRCIATVKTIKTEQHDNNDSNLTGNTLFE